MTNACDLLAFQITNPHFFFPTSIITNNKICTCKVTGIHVLTESMIIIPDTRSPLLNIWTWSFPLKPIFAGFLSYRFSKNRPPALLIWQSQFRRIIIRVTIVVIIFNNKRSFFITSHSFHYRTLAQPSFFTNHPYKCYTTTTIAFSYFCNYSSFFHMKTTFSRRILQHFHWTKGITWHHSLGGYL